MWLRAWCRARHVRLGSFQSLKGIMCDWEFATYWNSSYFLEVSIPERDYVWLRDECIRQSTHRIRFNPWKGLCVIESHQLPAAVGSKVVSIPERDYVWLRVSRQSKFSLAWVSKFQSLKGIMCDWEDRLDDSLLLAQCFNPWKGLCVIERAETWNA